MKKFALAVLALMACSIALVAFAVPIGTALTVLGIGTLAAFGMAVLDERLEFADAVSVAAAAGTALIGDVIDLSVIRDIGAGRPTLYFVITVDTEIITGGNAGTIQFQLVSDAQAAIATDGTATVHYASRLFVTDDAAANDSVMNAGRRPVCVAIPLEGVAYERYLGVLAVIATTTVTAGKINAFLNFDPPAGWKPYPDAL